MKISVGLPHISERVHTRFADSLIGMVNYSLGQGLEIERINTFRDNIVFARNKISSIALERKADYLLFIDDDMVFEPDALIKLLDNKKDITGALTFLRREPHEPSIYTKNSDGETYDPVIMWKPNSLIDIDALGMAFTLIKSDVFIKMKKISQFRNQIYGFFTHFPLPGEDLNFCTRAKEIGFEIFCDTSVVAGHIVEKIISYGDYMAMAEDKILSLKRHIAQRKYDANKPQV